LWPKEARDGVGQALFEVQMNRLPPDWKPMRTVGAGVCEIRVHTRIEHRLIYVARFEEAVYVLHAFEKRTQKTPRRDVEIARRRLAEVVRKRQSGGRS
jgi:phage-related protein